MISLCWLVLVRLQTNRWPLEILNPSRRTQRIEQALVKIAKKLVSAILDIIKPTSITQLLVKGALKPIVLDNIPKLDEYVFCA